jgi:hypothetical protein
MNRQERRARQAHLRRHANRSPQQAMRRQDDEGYMMITNSSAVPAGLKADITRVAQSVDLKLHGGSCVLRAAVGYRLLERLGFEPRVQVGGVLFRAGPDEIRDTVSFCGPGNCGQFWHGHMLGHVWLRLDDEYIDFSCCEWKRSHLLPSAHDQAAGLGAVQWQRDPPDVIWAPADLFDWQPEGTPELGKVWFCPWSGPEAPELLHGVMADAAAFDDIITRNIQRMKLIERVSALRAGDIEFADNARQPKPLAA